MPGKRKPISVLKATGKKHLTQAEIDERERTEVKAPTPKQVRAPAWLPTDLREEFRSLSRQLMDLDMGYCKLDRDTLARYLIAHQLYLAALNHVQCAISNGAAGETVKWTTAQGKYFQQCRECAGDLGLTLSSRCRLVVPEREGKEEDDPFLTLLEQRHA